MKERVFKFEIGILFGFALTSIILFGVILFWEWRYPLPYQISQPVTQSANTPADNGELTVRVENLENDQNFNLKALEWKMDQKLLILGWVALFISFAAGFMGLKTYNDLDKVIKEKIRFTLENELYQLDPVNLTIRIPKDHPDKENIQRRLKSAGLKNIKEYTELNNKCKVGLTLVSIENPDQEKDYIDFLDREKPDADDSAFVLYASNRYQLTPATINKHDRAATANMPATVVTAILAISRGLHRDRNVQIKKEEE